jgi:hypothetical protein
MKATIAVMALMAGIAGCAPMMGSAGVNWAAMDPGRAPDYETAKARARDAILGTLKDPDSAQFRNSTPLFKTLYNFGMASIGNSEPLWAMCIEVNAKNSYGGYAGYQSWLVKFRNGQPVHGELGVMHAEYDCQTGPAQASRRAG